MNTTQNTTTIAADYIATLHTRPYADVADQLPTISTRIARTRSAQNLAALELMRDCVLVALQNHPGRP